MLKFRVKRGYGYHFQKFMGDHLRDEDIVSEGGIVFLSEDQLKDDKIQNQMHKLEEVIKESQKEEPDKARVIVEEKEEEVPVKRALGRPRKMKMITNSTTK